MTRKRSGEIVLLRSLVPDGKLDGDGATYDSLMCGTPFATKLCHCMGAYTFDSLIDSAIDFQIDSAIDSLIDCKFDFLIDYKLDSLIVFAIDSLIDCAIDSLIDCKFDFISNSSTYNA